MATLGYDSCLFVDAFDVYWSNLGHSRFNHFSNIIQIQRGLAVLHNMSVTLSRGQHTGNPRRLTRTLRAVQGVHHYRSLPNIRVMHWHYRQAQSQNVVRQNRQGLGWRSRKKGSQFLLCRGATTWDWRVTWREVARLDEG